MMVLCEAVDLGTFGPGPWFHFHNSCTVRGRFLRCVEDVLVSMPGCGSDDGRRLCLSVENVGFRRRE